VGPIFNHNQCNEQQTDVTKALKNATYIDVQIPKRARFFDSSRFKIGRENLINCLALTDLNFDWIGNYSEGLNKTDPQTTIF